MKRIFILISFIFCANGCARHIVINPEEIIRYNNSDWSVKNVPGKAATGTQMQ